MFFFTLLRLPVLAACEANTVVPRGHSEDVILIFGRHYLNFMDGPLVDLDSNFIFTFRRHYLFFIDGPLMDID